MPMTNAGLPERFYSRSAFPLVYHVAKFWGLAEAPHDAAKDQASFERASRRSHDIAGDGAPGKPSFAAPAGAPQIVPVDIRAVINQALRAAGLMKAE
jgi:hypothetical protein